MAIDPTLEAALAELAEKLEDFAGITPTAALKKDMELSTRIRRITAAIQAGALEAHTLEAHTDVIAASPNDGDFLRYDSTLGAYVAESAALPDLSDVVDGLSPTIGQYLVYTASGWDAGNVDLSEYLRHDGTIPLSATWNAAFDITVPALHIEGTLDHSISSSSDELNIINPNANKCINFSVNRTGTGAWNFVEIDATQPSLKISNTSAISVSGSTGLIDVTGTWGTGILTSLMRFAPTVSAGQVFSFDIKPTMNTTGASKCFVYAPRYGTATSMTTTGFENTPQKVKGNAVTNTGFYDAGNYLFFGNSANPYTVMHRGLHVYHPGNFFDNQLTYNSIGLYLQGGIPINTTSSATQYGIKLEGYRFAAGGATVIAIDCDGGTIQTAGDIKLLSNTTYRMYFGTASHQSIHSDGTNLVLTAGGVSSNDIVLQTASGDIVLAGDIEHKGNNVGFFNATAVPQRGPYTQTYSTATLTHSNPTASALTDSTGGTADQTLVAITGSGDDANINNNFADLADEVNKLITDLANTKQVLNQVIDDQQTLGLFM